METNLNPEPPVEGALTKREYMAVQIMAGMLANETETAAFARMRGEHVEDAMAKAAVALTDALIKQLDAR